MAKIDFISAKSTKDLLEVEKLADTIWREHYVPIIGLDQVEYMLDKYQSLKFMKEQLGENIFYYLIKYEQVFVGYLSFKKEESAIFLSKIYVLNNFRGMKIGKNAMRFVEKNAKHFGMSKVYLTVNKYNLNSIKAYEKLGFKNIESLVTDIGGGFVMDDFKLEKQISQ